MATFASPWLIRYKRNPDATIRLFCFHCAGGSASEFRGWPAHLPGNFELIAVQLPGREGRVTEAFVASMEVLIDSIAEAISPFLDKPYVVFGHSFGSLVGFEVIRSLRRKGLRQPLLLVPAGRQAPQLKSKKRPIASLPREAFVEELRKDYGDHIGPILESPELQDVFVPQIHADFALSEAYNFRAERPLDCPIAAFAGETEKELEASELMAWSAQTSRSFRARRFPGDHFFIRESQGLVIEAIEQEVQSIGRERIVGSHALRM